MRILLCGFMGSGKTYYGERAAHFLQLPFYDTDKMMGSHRDVYQKMGEEAFRKKEEDILRSMIHSPSSLIALGGGTLSTDSNRALTKQLGCIIYLKTPFSILWTRIQARGLPVFADVKDPFGSLHALYDSRISLYESCANYIVACENKTAQEILTIIASCYNDSFET